MFRKEGNVRQVLKKGSKKSRGLIKRPSSFDTQYMQIHVAAPGVSIFWTVFYCLFTKNVIIF